MEIVDPKQLGEEALAEYNRANYLAAAQLYQAASEGYKLAGDELSGAEMANNCNVAFLKAGQPESALRAAMGTDELFARRGDTLRQAMALGNQGAAWEGLAQWDKAIVAYQQSAELLKQLGEGELRAYVMQSISAIQLRRGQFLEAYTTMNVGVMGLDKPSLSQKLLKSIMQLPFKFLR